MNVRDFVYKQIYSGAISAGADERTAHSHAVMGLDEYKKGKFEGSVSKLIEARIKKAKRQSK